MSRTTNSSKTEYVAPESRYIALRHERFLTASGILNDMPSNEVLDEDID